MQNNNKRKNKSYSNYRIGDWADALYEEAAIVRSMNADQKYMRLRNIIENMDQVFLRRRGRKLSF